MKIFVTHSSGYDFKNELYIPLRTSSLHQQHEIFLPRENDLPEVITKEHIKNSDIVVAEVSYPSTGQGIEIGWADIFQVPIVCIYQKGKTISGSLSKITKNFFIYSSSNEMIQKLEEYLKRFL